MKKIMVVSLILLVCSLGLSQEKDASKMEKFASRTGQVIKFSDYLLSELKSKYTVLETKVRKVEAGGDKKYFYQIVKEDEYNNKVASIAYEDLLEILKALETLSGNSKTDAQTNADYLENKFVTEDGFAVGYYAKNGSVNWYLTLERYGSGNSVFIPKYSKILNSFKEAKNKIESIKSK